MRWTLEDDWERRNAEHNEYVAKNKPHVLAWRKRNADILEWHRWFAWFPVAIDYSERQWRWLEIVERKAEGWRVSPGLYRWHYRDLKS